MDLTKKRIFLVEDNIGTQIITKTLLESHGAVVATHTTGQDILPSLLRFIPVDLIILDLMLPNGMTGFDVFSAIRSHPEFDSVPIITMSVIDRAEAVPQAKQRGFSGFISKPVDFQSFPEVHFRLLRHIFGTV